MELLEISEKSWLEDEGEETSKAWGLLLLDSSEGVSISICTWLSLTE